MGTEQPDGWFCDRGYIMNIFSPADILLPDFDKVRPETWSVIACDQFTGDPEYWREVEALVGDAPSTLRLTLPEIYLDEPDMPRRVGSIHRTMEDYLKSGIFREYKDSLIYTERLQSNGILRQGVVGKIDLSCYDYRAKSRLLVRATEATVLERIPPRIKVRARAPLELPHIMLLIDDPKDLVIGPCREEKSVMTPLYQTDLMQKGGHIDGYWMTGDRITAFEERLDAYVESAGEMAFAVGDGNHSLAAAKACCEKLWDPARPANPIGAALVELVNLHSPALQFEAIHRVMTRTNPDQVLRTLHRVLGLSDIPSEQPVTIVRGGEAEKFYIHKPTSRMATGSLQNALDAYISANPGKIDYIHGEETVKRLSLAPDAIGFLLPEMDKRDLFPSVREGGPLPRKTFSLGHALDKRYYMEARKLLP